MEEHYPETESLKAAIEAKMGKRLSTPADFTDLVAAIERETGEHVGITTVKRLWGYIGNDSRMREGTLSVFARFVGYADWSAFCANGAAQTRRSSRGGRSWRRALPWEIALRLVGCPTVTASCATRATAALSLRRP